MPENTQDSLHSFSSPLFHPFPGKSEGLAKAYWKESVRFVFNCRFALVSDMECWVKVQGGTYS